MLPEITCRQMVIFYHRLFFDIKKLMSCRRLPLHTSKNRMPASIATLTINDIEIKEAVKLPDLTIAYFHGPRAGKGASSMPNGGHAVVKRARWSAPASQ
ncbi:hypothetical protein [Ignatzschineria cameli]|uniref:Uncharacterized protein n=2 Tax=Ignatzschineria cameli TaxID=2182793 RepID=A0A2U2ALA7_9GAMM|nr:hypothetical protein [Ignatzschineria cameli]PWD83948.1 hypothetical protein DC077_08760 [Ignatzschineria cameli]